MVAPFQIICKGTHFRQQTAVLHTGSVNLIRFHVMDVERKKKSPPMKLELEDSKWTKKIEKPKRLEQGQVNVEAEICI